MSRIDWDVYFMDLCKTIAKRSTCLRLKDGAIAVKDNRSVSSGYIGAPSKIKD